jgi:dephospho-CoA kinase
VLYVVTGPPAAGKSSWIEAHATQRDIVIDLDRITRALTAPGAPQWNHDPIASKVALRARYAAIDEALKHLDQVDVYLIHTMPSRKALAKRIEAMRDPDMRRVATRWYRSRPTGSQGATRQASRAW